MKKLSLILTMLAISMMIGCAEPKTINGTTYQPAGWMEGYEKEKCVKYKVKGWNVAWSIILVELIFPPILITGQELWEPMSWDYNNPNCKKQVFQKIDLTEAKSTLTTEQKKLAETQDSSIGLPPSMGLPEVK